MGKAAQSASLLHLLRSFSIHFNAISATLSEADFKQSRLFVALWIAEHPPLLFFVSGKAAPFRSQKIMLVDC